MQPALPFNALFAISLAVVSFSAQLHAFAEEPKQDPAPLNYEDHIKPILRQHCLKCHGNDKQEAGINMQQYASLLKGGSGGMIVEAGRSSQSLLFKAITSEDDDQRMPPSSPPIPAEKIALIQQWIDAGLRESSSSTALAKTRDLSFTPSVKAGATADQVAVMPESLPEIQTPELKRPLPVVAMDVSPVAPLVAVSGQECIRLLQTDTEQELGRLPFPEGIPQVLRFSRDGAILMAAGGRPVESGVVVLFDVRTGKRLAEIGDELDAVLAADLSPDQSLVALGGSSRVVKVYSTADGTISYRITKHTDWITAASFSPDGTKLVTADRSGSIHLWDAKSSGILLNLAEHKSAVRALDWRADSKVLASTGEDGKIIWWDVTDGFPTISKPNAHPPQRPAGFYGNLPSGVLAGRFDAQGRLVTTGRDRAIRLWGTDGSPIKAFPLETGIPLCGAMANGGRTVVSGDSAGNVRFWKVE